ncbi:uncharacterized protein LOC132735303 [Ruditapes philippinarum]|uniref:uncharacterized protein LOC132735303 n=1 Tax=Ruditapes philippinarum TaxID=129788 RepID=UPI00295B55D5|nr:uncharacterized protein LOC132735303 [Ruditapes philippinarum]
MSTRPELNDLTGILIRFRMNKYAIATDIEKAFLNITLDENNRDVTRFLWLSDPSNPNSESTTYRYRAVLFGATSSPITLCATILKHLELKNDKQASEYLRQDLYIDNVISIFQQEEQLLQFYSDSRELMSSAGLLSPVTIRAKLRLQELWQQKFEWDMPLPDSIQEKWRSLITNLKSVTKTTFPRYYFKNTLNASSNTCIHIFCDASLVWYGATAYICRDNQSTLVMAKTRVAPLKKLTLPRLELMVAVIGYRLRKHMQRNTSITRIYLWSDSQIVLFWLQTPKTLSQFVRNRVIEIHALSENRKWNYCPTKENPADLLTRGISVTHFKNSNLWFHGPTLLTTPSNRAKRLSNISFIDMSRFSSLTKLLRVTAYVLRFIFKCRGGSHTGRLDLLTTDELRRVEEMCLRCCQMSKYQAEIEDTKSKRNKLPLCRQLQLFLDNGILKCRGRIHNAPLDELTKFPYLLPAKHPFTKAVHLELVSTLAAELFLQAFRCYCSRKDVMMSDNANTFISASKQLRDLFHSLTVREELNNRGIEWKMIPKRAHWFGGM